MGKVTLKTGILELFSNYASEEAGSHIKRVSLYSKLLAERLGLDEKKSEEIGCLSVFHDIGKIAISSDILEKPGKLTAEEFQIIKTHTEIGYEIVRKHKLGVTAENIVRYHHEKWDGNGYPGGLKGKEIPLEARIVTIADIYDALRHKRCYKESFTHAEALEILEEGSGRIFDPEIVEVFMGCHEEFDMIYERHKEDI